MKFPSYFPPNCPPDDAEAREVNAYRICKSSNISRADFRSFYEEGKDIKGKIQGYGISVFSDGKEAITLLKMPTHRSQYLAKGITSMECGVIKPTPSHSWSSHITWWLYENATPEKYFK